MVNAVVLGGGGEDQRLAGYYEGPTKGLIPLCGKPSVQWVLEALRRTSGVERIALAGPAALLEHPASALADVRLAQRPALREAEGSSIVGKLTAAAEAFDDGRKLLMATCDIPLATPASLADTITRCPDDCAFFHPLVEKAAALRDFPAHQWVFLKLRDGEVVTTNVIILDPVWLRRRPELAQTLEALRRHPVRMALRWGVGFLIRFRLGLLSLAYCENVFSKILQAPCRGAITSHSDLAMDLDRPEDVPMLERALQSRGAG
jgi:CTP:molybdopterin cytidylyltransferase MocA